MNRVIFASLIRRNLASYVQGQSAEEPDIREYFYYIDHMGQLFLDDVKMKNFTSCYKDEAFLRFFFSGLRENGSGRFPEFPFVSLCGAERNFLRAEDRPLVATALLPPTANGRPHRLGLCHAGPRLALPFRPHRLGMGRSNGRLYYEGEREDLGAILVRSQLADALFPLFRWGHGDRRPPTAIRWQGQDHKLTFQPPDYPAS